MMSILRALVTGFVLGVFLTLATISLCVASLLLELLILILSALAVGHRRRVWCAASDWHSRIARRIADRLLTVVNRIRNHP